MPRLLLASASPRRLALLRQVGYRPVVEPADVDETPDTSRSPEENAARFAREKARVIAARHAADQSEVVVLAADTVVVLDGELYGKPRDRADAERMLRRLSGREHRVVTCVCLLGRGEERAFACSTAVRFRALDEVELRGYLDAGEWRDKAGGYAVQGRAAAFTRSVAGSYSNVVGLPLCEVVEALDGFGLAPDYAAGNDGSEA